MTLSFARKHCQDGLEFVANGAEVRGIRSRLKERTLLLEATFGVDGQILSRPGDCEAVAVKQTPDLEHEFDVLAAVEPVPGFALHGFESRELSFPEPQDIGLDTRKLAHLADSEIELVRDEDLGKRGVGGAAGAR